MSFSKSQPKSLYSIMASLDDGNENGTLLLFKDNGDQAKIVMQNGRIVGIKTKDLIGAKAGRELAYWVDFHSEFHKGITASDQGIAGLEVQSFLTFLAKVEKRSKEIQKTVQLNSSYRFISRNLKGKKEFSPNEIQIALKLDGKTPLSKVISETGISDLEVLGCIYNFCRLGIAEKVDNEDFLKENQRVYFLEFLEESLVEYVGPAAEIILEEAFSFLKSEPQKIYRKELAELVESISRQLDEEDRIAFIKSAMDILKGFKS